jgi:hypothetical protein
MVLIAVNSAADVIWFARVLYCVCRLVNEDYSSKKKKKKSHLDESIYGSWNS